MKVLRLVKPVPHRNGRTYPEMLALQQSMVTIKNKYDTKHGVWARKALEKIDVKRKLIENCSRAINW
jgi:hypothetical protein